MKIFIYNNNIILLIFILPYIYFTFSNSIYIPGHDESNQIEAALCYYNNGTFSYSSSIPYDLSSNYFKFQNEWPIGFPGLLVLLLKLNFKLFFALKFIKLFSFLSTIFIWCKISFTYLRNNVRKIFFQIILVITLILISQSMTDLIITLLFSIIIYLLQQIESKSEDLFFHIKLGFICGIAFVIKYSSIFIFPSIILFFFIHKRRFSFKNLKFILLQGIIFSLFFGLIYYYNISNGEHKFYNLNSLSISNLNNLFYTDWITDISKVIVKLLFLDKIFYILHLYKVGLNFNFFCIFFSSLLFYFLFKILSNNLKDINILILLINLFVNIIFLKFLSAFFFDIDYAYKPITIERYFWPLTPLIYLILIKHISLSPRYTLLFIPISIFLFYVEIHNLNIKKISYNQIERNYNNIIKNINRLNLINLKENIIIFAENIQWSIYQQKGIYNVFEISETTKINFKNINNKPLTIIYINDMTKYNIELKNVLNPNKYLLNNLTNKIDVNPDVKIYWQKFK